MSSITAINMISSMNFAIKRREKVCFCRGTRINMGILSILEGIGCVKIVKANRKEPYKEKISYYVSDNLRSIKHVSKPSRKVYASLKEIHKYENPIYRKVIVSTNKGLQTGFGCLKLNVGGEVILQLDCKKLSKLKKSEL